MAAAGKALDQKWMQQVGTGMMVAGAACLAVAGGIAAAGAMAGALATGGALAGLGIAGTAATVAAVGAGVAAGGALHVVQQAFIDHGAIQCGFCTPGMVLAAIDLLRRHPQPTEQQVREGLSGNLCRCTGYQKIVEAVMAAADILAGREA